MLHVDSGSNYEDDQPCQTLAETKDQKEQAGNEANKKQLVRLIVYCPFVE